MKLIPLKILVLILTLTSCKSDNLDLLVSLPLSLKEISAAERTPRSSLIWMIEDSRNQDKLFGLNEAGHVIKEIQITNAVNYDWEDLTSDSIGNIYIGDFGDNKKNRESYIIYKVLEPDEITKHTTAEKISFRLPSKMKQENFEGFFIYNNHFYIFNKENKKGRMYKVPNKIGDHIAEFVTEFRLDGNKNKITSADISDDGKTVILLNRDKLWKITNFKSDDFFNGTIETFDFNLISQKEGVCFKDNQTVYITDERVGFIGGNIYTLSLN
jgi:hypothetical protein